MAKVATSATFTYVVDDGMDLFINGSHIGYFNCGSSCYNVVTSIPIPPALFNTSNCNVIAATVDDCCQGASWMSYKLDIFYGDGTKDEIISDANNMLFFYDGLAVPGPLTMPPNVAGNTWKDFAYVPGPGWGPPQYMTAQQCNGKAAKILDQFGADIPDAGAACSGVLQYQTWSYRQPFSSTLGVACAPTPTETPIPITCAPGDSVIDLYPGNTLTTGTVPGNLWTCCLTGASADGLGACGDTDFALTKAGGGGWWKVGTTVATGTISKVVAHVFWETNGSGGNLTFNYSITAASSVKVGADTTWTAPSPWVLQENMLNLPGAWTWTDVNNLRLFMYAPNKQTLVSCMFFEVCYSNPSPTPTQTPTRTITSTPTASPTFTGTASRTSTPTHTATPSPTPTRTGTETSTDTPTRTPSPTNTETSTQTGTRTDSPTSTESPFETATQTSSSTATPSASPTFTASPSATATASETPSRTETASATATPTATASSTETSAVSATDTPTSTETPSVTATPTETATVTSSPSLTTTPTESPSATASPTITLSPTPIPSQTPLPPLIASVRVYNSAGELVAILNDQMPVYGMPTGLSQLIPSFLPDQNGAGILKLTGPDLSLVWDGTSDTGQIVAGGSYSVVVEIHDNFGNVNTWSQDLTVIRTDQSTSVEVYNSAGELVWHQTVTPTSPGSVRLSGHELIPGADPTGLKISYGSGPGDFLNWNGTGSQGQSLSSGTYMIKVTQSGSGGKSTTAYPVTLIQASANVFAWVAAAPNPIRSGSTSVMVSLQGASPGIVAWGEAYNLAGEHVGSIGSVSGGFLQWKVPENLASGVYLLQVSARDSQGRFKSALVKISLVR